MILSFKVDHENHFGLWSMPEKSYVKFWQLAMFLMMCAVDADVNCRGPVTPGVICASAFNHKLKKFCTFRDLMKSFYLRDLTSGRKNWGLENEKAISWTIAAQKLSNWLANSRWLTDWPNHPLVWHIVVLSSFSLAESSMLKISLFYYTK